ncbi:winged helix-turn-helix domain-containing protein [Halobium palmae]|uniref:Winged helix-turn-helix domain-containing protein n=1 Tax=Halobium palmae TaxID=1776492 RepID=A0ABD5RW78_9EURY
MEASLWRVFGGTRGGANRARLFRAVEETPRNTNRLATDLELDFKTVSHHQEVLLDANLVQRSGDHYGAVYLPSELARRHSETIDSVFEELGFDDR